MRWKPTPRPEGDEQRPAELRCLQEPRNRAPVNYSWGAITYLGLLTAENTYRTRALLALVQARAARYADTAALFQALGGGWWNLARMSHRRKTWDIELIP